ncbi:ABC transporter permease [Salisediminibacterium halotolerans]|uniref:ABC transporter permease n=1 Tax=Salisediminibacterium halotolerans TaxID=517425 RepID=UPI000EACEF2D|nr:ABC transporter permease [Salisediminibacterium halotolerans]RLJ79336.1 peptide/nickel transport system permease protein [Actinophytocola xinjiangensis]RPE83414.1 peptide/nickel transport system permease protein [Salisediminibacterium halotolerans]TWG37778.1 peptide/nickel transport system permease protein [Salisediminibacterium halotolerans]GEL08513.1 oligopeptide transport system permease protein AppB [Salisediminibacterium halotolerans]
MYKYILRRFLIFIPMLFIVTVVVFTMATLAPGDPLTGEVLDPTVDPEVVEQRREALGLNDPPPVQYMNWLSEISQGNLGDSLHYSGRTVEELIMSRAPNTVYLAAFSLFITIVIGVPLGMYSARKQYTPVDYTATVFGFFGLAVPNFFFALIAVYVFSFQLGLFPPQGTISQPGLTGIDAFLDRLHHLVMPGITLGLASTAIYMRYTRSEMLDVMGQDFIRTARAKGMGEQNVLYKHTLRNALIPLITLLGFEFGTLLSGAVVTEAVFSFPGLGQLFLTGIQNQDFPLIMGINLIIAVTVLVGNLLADIMYAVVDPRIRYD